MGERYVETLRRGLTAKVRLHRATVCPVGAHHPFGHAYDAQVRSLGTVVDD